MAFDVEGPVRPVPAGLALLTELERAIECSSAHRRAAMLTQITDFFIYQSAQLTEDQIEFFDDVFSRLAADIEQSARAMLACRLAPVVMAPIGIIRILANDNEIEVASPILAQSERLDEAALGLSATTKAQGHLLAIARRKLVSEGVSDPLIERGNDQVLLTLADNPGARFSEAGLALLIRRSEGSDVLVASVGSRPDVPHAFFQKLMAIASDKMRARFIADNLHIRREYSSAEPCFQFASDGRPLIAISRDGSTLQVA